MKKTKFILLALFGLMISAGSVFASTDILLNPATVNVSKNQTFKLTINVDPKGVKNGAITTQLKYPANLLEATNFSFDGNYWQESPSSMPIDNVNGVLVKALGYKGGVASNVVFGVVTFKAKNNGSGKISVGSGSSAYDANSQNVFSGTLQSVDVTVGAAAATPAPTLVGTVGTPTPTPKAIVLGQKTGTKEPSPTPSPTISAGPEGQAVSQGGLFATIGGVVTLGTSNMWLGILVVLILIVVVYYLVKAISRRSKGKTPA